MLSKQPLENLTKSHLQLSRGKRSKRTSIRVSEGLEKLNASRDGRPDRIADDAGEESEEFLGNTAKISSRTRSSSPQDIDRFNSSAL